MPIELTTSGSEKRAREFWICDFGFWIEDMAAADSCPMRFWIGEPASAEGAGLVDGWIDGWMEGSASSPRQLPAAGESASLSRQLRAAFWIELARFMVASADRNQSSRARSTAGWVLGRWTLGSARAISASRWSTLSGATRNSRTARA